MVKRMLFGLLVTLMAILPLLTACPAETTPTPTPTTPPPSSPTPTPRANWWDKLGEPQYGGTITTRASFHMAVWDPWVPAPGTLLYQYEGLVTFDWALDREIWPFVTNFAPLEYHMGVLAESWEMQDPQTMVFYIRQGIHWQDKEPVNGREFTAYDVEHHYHRFLGIGSGYTQPSPLAGWLSLTESVNATDKYTVAVKFKEPNVLALFQFFDQANEHQIESPEAVEQGVSNDWHYAVGTGAWILTDFIDGTSVTFDRNPNYYGYDERHPQNQLPYADQLKVLIIPDIATAVAALRTGRLDYLTELNWQQAETLAESNPELKQAARPYEGPALDFRVDHKPFTDIRVRKALQIAIDRTTIAMAHYGGTTDGTPTGLLSPAHKGYYFPYEDWPQELKDEYSYDPETARALLAEAGYPNGFETNVVTASNADLEFLEIVKAYFMDIGVDMDIEVMDPMTQRSFVVAMKHDQMAYSTMHSTATTRPPHNMLFSRYSQEKELNLAGVNDPGYDALMVKFQTSTNEVELASASRDCDRYILENHWALYTFPTVSYTAYQPYLKGYIGDGSSGGGGVGWGIIYARWWLDQSQMK